MKKLTFYLLFLVSGIANAQTFKPDENFKSTYNNDSAYQIDSVIVSAYTKQQLYSNAMGYITQSFKDSRSVIEMKDADLGEIAFRGNVSRRVNKVIVDKKGKKTDVVENVYLFFKCRIYVKDNKYKIVLSALEYPMSEILGLDLRFTVSLKNESENNTVAKDIALNLIRDMSDRINKKPESDF